jgi:hypothetical protein
MKESSGTPSLGDNGWTAAKPSDFTVSAGSGVKTVYAWGRDVAGNVSTYKTISLTYNDPADLPVIYTFTLTSADPTNSLAVSFSLSGNTNVVQWLVTESATAPDAGAGGWSANVPGSCTLSAGADGSRTLWAWGKNAYGVVSSSRAVSLMLDRVAPSIDTFTLTSGTPTSNPYITFSLMGSSEITGWIVNRNSSAPLPSDSGWQSSKPVGYTLNEGYYGDFTVYAWAKDAAGNVSASISSSHLSVGYYSIPGGNFDSISTLTSRDYIGVNFTEPMDPMTFEVSGNLGSYTWDFTGNYFRIFPGTEWPTGSSLNIIIDCKSEHGIPAERLNGSGWTIFRGVCVRAIDGQDSNPGTAREPRRSIASAISKAVNLGYGSSLPCEIRIAKDAGTATNQKYTTDWYGNSGRIIMVEGISLLGGYLGTDGYIDDWSLRNAVTYVSTVIDLSSSDGSGPNFNRAIDCGSGLTNATVIDGLTIMAAGSTNCSTPIFCNGSSPTISNCILWGGGGQTNNTAANWSYGLVIKAASQAANPIVYHNTINAYGGTNVDSVYGIYLEQGSSNSFAPVIDGNTIRGGRTDSFAGTLVYGIYALGASAAAIIKNNSIEAGMGTSTSGIAFDGVPSGCKAWNNVITSLLGTSAMYGISAYSSAATILNNTVICGSSAVPPTHCIHIEDWGGSLHNPTVENNILMLTNKDIDCGCMWEMDTNSDPAVVRNNAFWCGDSSTSNDFILYHDSDGSGDSMTITAMESDLTGESIGNGSNVRANPALLSSSGYRFGGTSPTSITQGGTSLSGSFTTDKDGQPRPGSDSYWSIGAYEP